jgi:hypothetical protein
MHLETDITFITFVILLKLEATDLAGGYRVIIFRDFLRAEEWALLFLEFR